MNTNAESRVNTAYDVNILYPARSTQTALSSPFVGNY